jgi:hypothetical protein
VPGTVSQTGIKFQNEKLARNKRGPTSGKPDESAVANSSVVNAMEAARGPRQGRTSGKPDRERYTRGGRSSVARSQCDDADDNHWRGGEMSEAIRYAHCAHRRGECYAKDL